MASRRSVRREVARDQVDGLPAAEVDHCFAGHAPAAGWFETSRVMRVGATDRGETYVELTAEPR